MPGRRALLLAFGAGLGALFLLIATRRLDWAAFAAEIVGARPGQVALGLVCLLCFFGIKAERWKHLVSPFAHASGRELQGAVVAGLAGNFIFPHVGEFARAALASRRFNAPSSAFLGSIAVERIFDFVALLGVVLAVLVPLGGIVDEVRVASFTAAAFCAALLLGVALFVFRTDACIRFAQRMLTPISGRLAGQAAHHVRHVRIGLGAIGTPSLVIRILGWSVLQWIAVLGCVVFSLRAVDAPVSVASAVSVLLLNVIGLTLPAAPGHLGTVQIAFIAGLAPFGVGQAAAFAASVVYNALMVVPTVLLGLPGLRRAGAALHERLAAR